MSRVSPAPSGTVSIALGLLCAAIGRADATPESLPHFIAGFAAAPVESVLSARQHPSFAQTIESLPGLRARGEADPLARIYIRGLTRARVALVDDGFPVEDFWAIDVDGPRRRWDDTERVRVVRGPASVWFGPGALAGAVTVVRAPLPEARDGGSVLRGEVGLAGATASSEAEGALRIEGARGPLGFRVSSGWQGSGPASATAHPELPGFHGWDWDAAAAARLGNGSMRLGFERQRGAFDVSPDPGPFGAAAGARASMRRMLENQSTRVAMTQTAGNIAFEAKAQWQQRAFEFAETYGGSRRPRLEMDVHTLELTGHHAGGGWTETVGVSGRSRVSESRVAALLVPDARGLTGSTFGQLGLDRGGWRLVAGGRVDFDHLEARYTPLLRLATQSRRFDVGSMHLGLTREGERLVTSASVRRAWRAPTLLELYANGPSIDGGRFEIGSRDLEPELVTSVDGSVAWRSGRVRTELALFASRVNDFIDLEDGAEARVGLPIFRYRTHAARLIGGETTARLAATDALAITLGLDVVRGDDLDRDRPLSFLPPPRWRIGSEWRRGPFVAELEVEGVTRPRLGAYDAPASAYSLVHVGGEYRWGPEHRPVRLGLRIENLGDTPHREFTSRDGGMAFGTGRRLRVRSAWGWGS